MSTRAKETQTMTGSSDPLAFTESRWGVRVLHTPVAELVDQARPVDGALLIGRVADDQVHLPIADQRMSRHHCRIVLLEDGTGGAVSDLGSKNGTWIGGQRVERAPLSDGTIFRVGNTWLAFRRFAPGHFGWQGSSQMVGRSALIFDAVSAIERVAPTSLPVLFVGETGTGKEVAARMVHEHGGRTGDLVALNCATMPETLVESTLFGHVRGAFSGATADKPGYLAAAAGGTLFLDEIGELPPAVQPKLLRLLESGEYAPVGSTRTRKSTARIVAATNRDLEDEIAAGAFRADLYARLARYVVRLPPLRERREDVPALVRHLVERYAPGEGLRVHPDFLDRLLNHDWPMNVRELAGLVERAAVVDRRGQTLTADLLPEGLGLESAEPAEDDTSTPSASKLRAVLHAYQGNVAAVAKHFGRERRQIYRWLKRHELDPADFR